MYFSSAAILALLPLALSAPAPSTGSSPSSIHPTDQNSLKFFAAHANNAAKVKRSVQVKVRRPMSGSSMAKRACKAPVQATVDIGGPASASSSALPSSQSSSPGSNFAAQNGDAVFPVSVKSSWTTVQGRSGSMSFNDALKPLTAGKLPPAISAPDGSSALQASYPANTVKYSSSTGHGYSFYTLGAHNDVDVTTATEVLFSYSVYFSDGFDFVKGGKLPGLYGGESLESAKSCSGGRQDERDTCFSARMMWRADGAGELYNYFPENGGRPDGYCSIAPKSVCDANYGDSIGRGSFYFPTGKWTTVTQRLRLNTPASASNGEQELYVDGKSVLKVSSLQIRKEDQTKIYGIMAQTFFGGSDQSWASPKDQYAWFKDWSLGISY